MPMGRRWCVGGEGGEGEDLEGWSGWDIITL